MQPLLFLPHNRVLDDLESTLNETRDLSGFAVALRRTFRRDSVGRNA